MLELIDRPTAYEDVGRLCRWGMVIHELKNHILELDLLQEGRRAAWRPDTIDQFIHQRAKARETHLSEMANVASREPRARRVKVKDDKRGGQVALLPPIGGIPAATPRRKSALTRRSRDIPGKLLPPRGDTYLERRGSTLMEPGRRRDRRKGRERRQNAFAVPFPDRRLTRSAYEQVFLKLVSGGRLRIGSELYTPVGMRGWYHAIFRRDSDGSERLITIDQLLGKMGDWV